MKRETQIKKRRGGRWEERERERESFLQRDMERNGVCGNAQEDKSLPGLCMSE